MNSGPLSRHRRGDAPRSSTSSSSARITRTDGRRVSISMRSDSRWKSSLTLEGAQTPPGPQCIGHEVGRPGVVGMAGNRQGLAGPIRQAPLAAARQVELHRHVNRPTAGLAEASRLLSLVEQQAKTMAGIVLQAGIDRLDQRRVVSQARGVVPRRARQAQRAVGTPGTQTA